MVDPTSFASSLQCTDALPAIRAANGWLWAPEDALADLADLSLSGSRVAAGQTNGALVAPLTFSGGTAEGSAVFVFGKTVAAAKAALATGTKEPFAARLAASEAAAHTALAGAALPDASLGARVRDVAQRALVNVYVARDRGVGAFAASVSRQAPYYPDWPRDGAFISAALDVAGLHAWVTQRHGWYVGLQRTQPTTGSLLLTPQVTTDPDSEQREFPAFAWEMNYFTDGPPGGAIRFEIDNTALHVWSTVTHTANLTGKARASFLTTVWPSTRDALDLLTRWRDKATGLPAPADEDDDYSMTSTLHGAVTVYPALVAGARLAHAAGDDTRSLRYVARAAELHDAILANYYDADAGLFRDVRGGPAGAQGGDTGWFAWPGRVLDSSDPRLEAQLDADMTRVLAILHGQGEGGTYLAKNVLAAALLGKDGGSRDKAREAVQILAGVATADTLHFGEVYLSSPGPKGTLTWSNRVDTPHVWEGVLFYLSAMALSDPARFDLEDQELPPAEQRPRADARAPEGEHRRRLRLPDGPRAGRHAALGAGAPARGVGGAQAASAIAERAPVRSPVTRGHGPAALSARRSILPPAMFPRRASHASPALLAALLAACAGAPPAPPPTVRLDPGPASAPLSLPLAARWVESNGCTFTGPSLPGPAGGTLVVLGGRRALVREDGALVGETAAAPEPLCGLVEVPSVDPGGGVRLVGHGAHGVYRFDDPLGAPVTLAKSQERIARIGAGASVVAVWTGGSDLPRFLDVASGQEKKLPGLPAPPLRALAFADARRGAAVFEAVGLAVTGDGGATWRLASESVPFDALRASGLRRRSGGVRAFAFADGPDGAVDLDGARLGAFEPPRPSTAEPPLLRWVRATGRDPLEAVASGGLDLPGGGDALVASHGLLARVDPQRGGIGELVEIPHGAWASPCGAGRSGQTVWIACTVREDADQNLFDPFGVMRVPLGEGAITVERPALVRNGEAELRVSPSGGAMLLAACSNEETGSACVRQPDGKWRTIALDLADRGAGPLADGRVAFLRGMFDGDEAPSPAPSSPAPAPPGDDAQLRRLHVAVAGPDGVERALAPIAFTPSRGYVRVQSPIEEDPDRTLRFVIEDGEGPFAVSLPPGHDLAQARHVPDAAAARLRAGRGVAVGEGRVLASLDGGGVWSDLSAPPGVLDAARAAAASYDDPDQLAVSEVGAKIGPMLRIGWGPEATAPEPPPHDGRPATGAPLLAARPSPAAPAEQTLACASQGAIAGTPPLAGSTQVKQLLAGPADRHAHPLSDPAGRVGAAAPIGSPEASSGTRHETSLWSSGRAGMLDTLALLDEEGPAGASAPEKWTVRWHDPTELGGRVRSASLPSPKGAAFGTSLRFASASGGRALFALRSGGKLRLVRVRPSGAAEAVEVGNDLIPFNEVAFGEGKSEAIAWIRDTKVIVWLPGERPRAIARIGTHATRLAGAPTAAGVPLLLAGSDWSLLRTPPVPPLDRPGASLDPAPLSLDGWTRLPPLPRRLDSLPACSAHSAGARFTLARPSLRAEIDGAGETAGQALYDVRLDPAEACLAGVTAILMPDHQSAQAAVPAPTGKGKPPSRPAPASPAGFVRADLVAKRAEGGERGLPPAPMTRMTCVLAAKP